MGKNAKVSPVTSGRILACSIAALLLASESASVAQEGAWIGTESGDWSVPANWQGGVVPVGGPESTLRFSATVTSSITATNDLAVPFSIRGLRFQNTGSGLFTVTGGALQLTGTSPEVVQADSGHVTLSTPLILNASNGGIVKIGGTGRGDVTLTGPITEAGGSQSLIIAGQPVSLDSQIITLTGENSATGGIILESGNLALGSAAIGAGNAPLLVKGGTLRFAQGASFTNPVALHHNLLLVGASEGKLGPISSTIAGTGITMKMTGSHLNGIPVPRLTIDAPSNYTGATRIYGDPTYSFPQSAGAILLTGAGAILQTSEIDLQAGGGIIIDGVATGGSINRISDAAVIRLRGGQLMLRAAAGSAVPQVESVGAITIGGRSVITVDVFAGDTIGAQLRASFLEREGNGTLHLSGIPAGTNPMPAASRATVLLGSPPPDMVGEGSGVKTPIVPYAIGKPWPNLTNGLVAYTADVGFRLLGAGEYATQFGVEGSNVTLPSGGINNVHRTVNSLVIGYNAKLSGTGGLTITSGLVFAQGGGAISQTLNFGATDGKIFAGGVTDFTIDGTITGQAGLTMDSERKLVLTGINTFSGPLTLNSGVLSFHAAENLGDRNSPVVFNGAYVGLNYAGLADVAVAKDVVLGSGSAWVQIEGPAKALHLNGQISGAGDLILGGTRGKTIRLTGENTFTGALVLRDGNLEISSDSAIGSGTKLHIQNGAVKLLGDWSTNKTIHVEGYNVVFDTAGFDAVWNGPVIGEGSFKKSGEGVLTLTSSVIVPSWIEVLGGTLTLAVEAAANATTWRVTGALHSDQSAVGSTSHLNRGAAMYLPGAFDLTGRSGAMVAEAIGTLFAESSIVSLKPGSGENSGAYFHVDQLISGRGGLMIRADNLGGPNSRFSLNAAPLVRGGLAIGVYSQTLGGGPEFFATYDGGNDERGVIGFRTAPHLIADAIHNPVNGGATPVNANVVAPAGGTIVTGPSNHINSLIIAPGGGVTLSPEQLLHLEAGAILTQSGDGASSIMGGKLDLGDSTALLAIHRDLEIYSEVVGSSSIQKDGFGELTIHGPVNVSGAINVAQGLLRLKGNNTHSGGTWVSGSLSFDSDAALGTGTLGFSGTSNVKLEGPWTTSRKVLAGGTFALNGYSAALEGPFEGAGRLVVQGPGSVSLKGTASFTGALELGADLTFSGSGFLKGDITTTTGKLILDNRTTASSDRLGNEAAFRGASPLFLIGNTDVPVNELVGNISVPELGTQAGVTLISPGAARTILNSRTFTGGSGLVTIAGTNLGGSSGGFTRLFFFSTPPLHGNLLAGALASDSPGDLPESFALYESASDTYGRIGVRVIREPEYTSTPVLNTAASANFLATSEVSLGSGRETINSLTMRGGGALAMTQEQTLAITNGSVLVQSDASAVINGGRLDLGTTARFIVNGALSLDSALTTSRFEKYGPGVMRLGDMNLADTMSIAEGTLVLEGSVSNNGGPLGAPITTEDGAMLAGSGVIEGRVMMSGTLSPGDEGVGIMRTRGLTLNPESVLRIDLASPSWYDRLEVAGSLVLGGPVALSLMLSFDPADGIDAFTLIANDGDGAVSLSSGGHFTLAGITLREGAHFLVEEQYFEISYAGGDGNDVVVRAVPEPSTSLLALSGVGALLSRRRRSVRCES